ncbi:MAG: transposon-encoded TnpW family protein [Clostridiales bacterium]|nr:transposon-encoded TnpW family protein [Clostridiales bacterium]
MKNNNTAVTITEHKIGKITYIVYSSSSENATDTLDKKIKKLIRKDFEQKFGM